MFGKQRFGREDFRILSREVVYEGFYRMLACRVRHRLFRGGWGKPLSRELFERPHAAAVLPYDPDRDLVGLVEQFRIGALDEPEGPWLLEVVAGLVKPGETSEEVARRELLEEAGLQARTMVPMHDLLLSPGGSNERMALYCGLVELSPEREGVFGLEAEGEDIRLHVVSREQALEALAGGRCNNAPLTIALQWLALHHGTLATGGDYP